MLRALGSLRRMGSGVSGHSCFARRLLYGMTGHGMTGAMMSACRSGALCTVVASGRCDARGLGYIEAVTGCDDCAAQMVPAA